MPVLPSLRRISIDPFSLGLVLTILLAWLLPASGPAVRGVAVATSLAIGLMFFLYGARLPTEAILSGMRNWRLHLTVLLSTYALFPLLGLLTVWVVQRWLPPALCAGVLFLCLLPSTVQSSIAFTSIARGNVPAAICAAATSNLLGVALTPALVALLMRTGAAAGGGVSLHAVGVIAAQLLLPFVVGQLLRPWIGAWATHHRILVSITDRGAILLVVYGAFSDAVTSGLWHQFALGQLLVIAGICAVLLAIVLAATACTSRWLGFSRSDEIAVVFCGSKKSLASGVPMAKVLFAGQSLGMILLPLMLFHQLQLLACAALARRYAAQPQTRPP